MSNPPFPPFEPVPPGVESKLSYTSPTVVVRGSGVLNSAITENLPGAGTSSCNIYDAATLNETIGLTPLATIGANSTSANLNLAFTKGLVVAPVRWQTVSVAITPSPTATML